MLFNNKIQNVSVFLVERAQFFNHIYHKLVFSCISADDFWMFVQMIVKARKLSFGIGSRHIKSQLSGLIQSCFIFKSDKSTHTTGAVDPQNSV